MTPDDPKFQVTKAFSGRYVASYGTASLPVYDSWGNDPGLPGEARRQAKQAAEDWAKLSVMLDLITDEQWQTRDFYA